MSAFYLQGEVLAACFSHLKRLHRPFGCNRIRGKLVDVRMERDVSAVDNYSFPFLPVPRNRVWKEMRGVYFFQIFLVNHFSNTDL